MASGDDDKQTDFKQLAIAENIQLLAVSVGCIFGSPARMQKIVQRLCDHQEEVKFAGQCNGQVSMIDLPATTNSVRMTMSQHSIPQLNTELFAAEAGLKDLKKIGT